MRPKVRKYALFALLGIAICFLFFAVSEDKELKVYFLDVGQGDAALIRFPCGKNMLIDAGDAGQNNTDIATFLRRAGVRELDAVILSHAHADHAGGMSEILEKIPAKIFIEPGLPHTTDIYINLLETVLKKEITYKNARRGDSLGGFGNVEISFLNPPENLYDTESALNNNSIVTLIKYKDVKFLFTGDIESRAETGLVGFYGNSLSADILKAPHHGSGTSSTPDFIRAVNPFAAVISAGADNRFGHPHESVLKKYEKAGVKIFRTDIDGTVAVSTDGRRIRVSRGR